MLDSSGKQDLCSTTLRLPIRIRKRSISLMLIIQTIRQVTKGRVAAHVWLGNLLTLVRLSGALALSPVDSGHGLEISGPEKTPELP